MISKEVSKLHFGYPYYRYPYTISVHQVEKREPENREQIITKHIRIAEEVHRRISSIDERFARIEKMIQERMKRGN
jgi:hypothetical protein